MAFVTSIPLPLQVTSGRSLSPRHKVPIRTARPRRLPEMTVVEAKSTKDMDKILEGAEGTLVVVDYSTAWCGPCKIIAPIFEEMSETHKDVVFVKVMGDATPEAGELMRREGIRSVPAFHFWKDKERVRDIIGARAEEVEKAVEELK